MIPADLYERIVAWNARILQDAENAQIAPSIDDLNEAQQIANELESFLLDEIEPQLATEL